MFSLLYRDIEYFRFYCVVLSSQVLQIRLGFIKKRREKKGGNRDVIEQYDTRKGDIRKIRHSGPG